MSTIDLCFVNNSDDAGNAQIIIFGAPHGPVGNGNAVEAPLLVHRVFPLPPLGKGISVPHEGRSIAVAVALSAIPGTLLDPASSIGPPVRLALPDTPSAYIHVRGGGTAPVFFTVVRDASETPHGKRSGDPASLPDHALRVVRRVWQGLTGRE